MEHCRMVYRESLIKMRNFINNELDHGGKDLEWFAAKIQEEAAIVASNAIVVSKEVQGLG